MTTIDTLMALADAYSRANREEANALENGGPAEFEEANEATHEARAALLAALTEALAQPIDTSPERVEKSGGNAPIGCVQHDCAECKARDAKPEMTEAEYKNMTSKGAKAWAGVDVQELRTGLAAQEPLTYDKTALNKYVMGLYEERFNTGEHGFYETIFHVVHKAIERAHGIL